MTTLRDKYCDYRSEATSEQMTEKGTCCELFCLQLEHWFACPFSVFQLSIASPV